MSKLGTEAQLLARLMEQARKAKMAAGGAQGAVASEATEGEAGPIPVESDEEVSLQTRLLQKKRKATVGSSVGTDDVPSARPLGDVVTATGLTVGDHVPAPSKKTKLATAVPKGTRPSKLSIVAKEALLEDEGFIRHVAERLKSAGLDRMVQAQGSPRENRARAFDSILRGLHNLYLIDSLEEDVALKEQVATLEAGLLVEKTEKKNLARQRDTLKTKLESTIGERDKLKARVSELEKKEASRCQALEDEVAGLKAKVAELPEVVARERRVAAEEALEHFRSSSEVAALKEAEYDRGFEAGYSQHFHTLIEKGWINVDQYYADMEREARERQEKDAGPEDPPAGEPCSKPPGGEVELIHVEDETEDLEGCGQGEGQEVFGTPEKPAAQGDAGEGDAGREGLKPNGDPMTPGITPSTGGLQS